MRINELEEKAGLDRATIRYYEKEGMIAPLRLENGYRDYSKADLETLTKIKLLRQLGMSLDQIRKLQQGNGDLQAAINDQMPKLSELKDHAQRAIQVCQLMRSDNVAYDSLNAEYYLHQLRTMSVQSSTAVTAPVKEFREVIWRDWHPARRFFARMTDQLLMVLIIFFVQAVVLKRGLDTLILYPFNFLSYLAIIPFEALCIHFFGTTLGKYIFGIHVTDADGMRLGLRDSFRRSWEVYRYGLGFGIPVWSLWRLYRSYKHYDEYEMDWDYECEVTYPISRKRGIIGVIALVLAITMLITGIVRSMMPKHLESDLNLQQFVQNYNHYWKRYGNSVEFQLNSDGTFRKMQHDDNVIIIGGNRKFDHFQYEFDDNVVKKVTYSEKITDFYTYSCIPERGLIAALTLFSASEGKGEKITNELRKEIESNILSALLSCSSEMTLECENLLISWKLEFENAMFDDSRLKAKDSPDAVSYAKVIFEIAVID